MQYSQADFILHNAPEFGRDILTAALAELGFETFIENGTDGLTAYIRTETLCEETLREILKDFAYGKAELTSLQECEDKDWNAEWERNSFRPIQIGEECIIHAPFHKDIPSCRYDIVINPRMAFGTGTHQTTSLILHSLLQMPLAGKRVLDMGCGTGVLGILAHKRGAAQVTAIDIDDWCTENTAENSSANGITDMEILQGDARLLAGRTFEVILANINRNILLMDMPLYADALATGGTLIMSGFYTEDVPLLEEKGRKAGLLPERHESKDNWAMLTMTKA